MNFGYLSLCLCVLAISLVSGEQNAKPTVAPVVTKPTVAPLKTSTVKPTSAPQTTPKPTRPMLLNVPPQQKLTTSQKPARSEEPLAMSVPATQQIPLQITGFITANGTIFEVEDKNGIGQIETRDNGELLMPKPGEIICNYGSIVIYSDVPCDQVADSKTPPAVQQTTPQAAAQLQQSTEGSVDVAQTQKIDSQQESLNDGRGNNGVNRRNKNKKRQNLNRKNTNGNKRQYVVRKHKYNKKRQGQAANRPQSTQPQQQQQQPLPQRRRPQASGNRTRQQQKKRQQQRQQQRRRQQQQQQRQRRRPQATQQGRYQLTPFADFDYAQFYDV